MHRGQAPAELVFPRTNQHSRNGNLRTPKGKRSATAAKGVRPLLELVFFTDAAKIRSRVVGLGAENKKRISSTDRNSRLKDATSLGSYIAIPPPRDDNMQIAEKIVRSLRARRQQKSAMDNKPSSVESSAATDDSKAKCPQARERTMAKYAASLFSNSALATALKHLAKDE